MIRRQLEHSSRARQTIAPIFELLIQNFALQVFVLPLRIIGILQREFSQWTWRPTHIRLIKCRQLTHEQTDRPAVSDRVVLRNQQHVTSVGQLEYLSAQ